MHRLRCYDRENMYYRRNKEIFSLLNRRIARKGNRDATSGLASGPESSSQFVAKLIGSRHFGDFDDANRNLDRLLVSAQNNHRVCETILRSQPLVWSKSQAKMAFFAYNSPPDLDTLLKFDDVISYNMHVCITLAGNAIRPTLTHWSPRHHPSCVPTSRCICCQW